MSLFIYYERNSMGTLFRYTSLTAVEDIESICSKSWTSTFKFINCCHVVIGDLHLNVAGNKKTKWLKHDNQSLLRSVISAGTTLVLKICFHYLGL